MFTILLHLHKRNKATKCYQKKAINCRKPEDPEEKQSGDPKNVTIALIKHAATVLLQ